MYLGTETAFICRVRYYSDTTKLRKQFIPAGDAVQVLWKKINYSVSVNERKICNGSEDAVLFNYDIWRERSTVSDG